MATSTPISPRRHEEEVNRLLVFAIVAALVAAAVLAISTNFGSKKATLSSSHGTRAMPVAATPRSYANFVGRVVTVSPDVLTVKLTLTNDQGVASTKLYQVHLDSATELKTISQAAPGSPVAAAQAADVHPGDTVQVFGREDQNLYPVSEFTATRLFKITVH